MIWYANMKEILLKKKRQKEENHIMSKIELAVTCSTFILKEKNIGNILIDHIFTQISLIFIF